jgi:hypothetical protein
MDFGDILTLLLYIVIPVVVLGKRKAKKERRSSQQRKQPVPDQQRRQPSSGRTVGGGLMGRLESMMRELEKAAEEQKAPGRKKTAAADEVKGKQKDKIPVWQVAVSEEKKEAHDIPEKKEKPVLREYRGFAPQMSLGVFGQDDLVKGIIMSEILQPPVSKRRRHLN